MRHEAIRKVHPNVVTIDGDLDAFDKEGNKIVLDESKIKTEQDILVSEYDALQYQRDRRYPSIGDQLDEIYHNGIDEWKKSIKAVKDKHPKP
tara:strand:+ start:347 stop:622 length:276 start_codon:yes stop_codon:yes gene_type:complete